MEMAKSREVSEIMATSLSGKLMSFSSVDNLTTPFDVIELHCKNVKQGPAS